MQKYKKGQKLWFKGWEIHYTDLEYEPQEVKYVTLDPNDTELIHLVSFSKASICGEYGPGESWWVSDDQLTAEIPEGKP